jgi:hypothetical protein
MRAKKPEWNCEPRLRGEPGQDIRGVSLGFHFIPDLFNLSIWSDKECAAHNPLVSAAHEFLCPPGSKRFDHFVRRIAQEREIQLLLGLENLQRFNGVSTSAEDVDAALIKLRFCVTKLGRFDCSTGSVGLREKEN